MCETSNMPALLADGVVLLDDARVLDGHLAAGERDHARAEPLVLVVERGAEEGSGGGFV